MQKVPDFNLVGYEDDIVCDDCGTESEFTIGGEGQFDGKFRCKSCFASVRPEYTEALVDFGDLLDLMIELKNSKMTLEDMYALYGNQEEEEEPDS